MKRVRMKYLIYYYPWDSDGYLFFANIFIKILLFTIIFSETNSNLKVRFYKVKIKDWNKKTIPFKILTIFGLIISVTIVVLALMQIFNIWDNAINVFEPLLGVLMIIQAIENWKTNRSTAYFSLFVAIFIFLVAIIILF